MVCDPLIFLPGSLQNVFHQHKRSHIYSGLVGGGERQCHRDLAESGMELGWTEMMKSFFDL